MTCTNGAGRSKMVEGDARATAAGTPYYRELRRIGFEGGNSGTKGSVFSDPRNTTLHGLYTRNLVLLFPTDLLITKLCPRVILV